MPKLSEAEQIEGARLLIDGTLASAEIQTAVLASNTKLGAQQAATAVFVTDDKAARR